MGAEGEAVEPRRLVGRDLADGEVLDGQPGTDATIDDGRSVAVERLERTPSFGSGITTALGSAMLGFEQALRSQPPPEVMAAEHQAIRGLSGEDDGLVLLFPDEPSIDAKEGDESSRS
jgi:hypothetical protein